MPGSMIDCLTANTARTIPTVRPTNYRTTQPSQVQENTIPDPRIIAELQRQASIRNNFSQSEGH